MAEIRDTDAFCSIQTLLPWLEGDVAGFDLMRGLLQVGDRVNLERVARVLPVLGSRLVGIGLCTRSQWECGPDEKDGVGITDVIGRSTSASR